METWNDLQKSWVGRPELVRISERLWSDGDFEIYATLYDTYEIRQISTGKEYELESMGECLKAISKYWIRKRKEHFGFED